MAGDVANAPNVMAELITKEERNEERKKKIMLEMEKLFTGLTQGLESKSREAFNSKFTALKTFIFDLTTQA